MEPSALPPLSLRDMPLWYAAFSALALAWGACIGSFLNACAYRIPFGLSVVRPRSFCPVCHMKVAWYDNVPLLGWLFLGGRCRCCRTFIRPRYLLIEALTAVLFAAVWLKFDLVDGARPLGLDPIVDPYLLPVYCVFIAGLVLGTFVDFEHLIIPDRVTIGGIAAGLVLSVAVPSLHGVASRADALRESAVGAAAGFGLLWAVAGVGRAVFKKEAMGFGDVKLLGAIGAFLGWRAVLFTVVVSSFLGSAVGLALVLLRARHMQSRIPYGPYLALAALLWVLWGASLWASYLGLILPQA